MKVDPSVGIAEFVGAGLCRAAGIPVCDPTVVTLKGKQVFGSRFEHGLRQVNDHADFTSFWQRCVNKDAMSAVLAVDLLTGNNDRHWGNWLYQDIDPSTSILRALDFSRAWPTSHPPTLPSAMLGTNTVAAFELWPSMGITFDSHTAVDVCHTLAQLNQQWIEQLLEPLPVEWKVSADGPALCAWWGDHWQDHVNVVKDFLSNGAWI